MLRYIYGDELDQYPELAEGMFRDRARQFSERLGWQVTVDARGHERDDYDALNPLYVIWQDAAGRHGGSMRFLPTTGRTMVNDHFLHLVDGVRIESPFIWECTRFCLSPAAKAQVSVALALGAGELMAAYGLKHYVGVFDGRMERIYRRLGLEPEVIGSQGAGGERLGIGLWRMNHAAFAPVLEKVGISRDQSRDWFARSRRPALLKTG